MSTYVIGDIHGCLDGLKTLLDVIAYDPASDRLYFAGDLVNRGPQSLETLRFVRDLPGADTVLGNHDLHALALYTCALPRYKRHNMHSLLDAPDVDDLMDWLRSRPMVLFDEERQVMVVHAGLHPKWSVEQVRRYAGEVEQEIRSDQWRDFMMSMYGNEPKDFSEGLEGEVRHRCIVNILTRMRFLDVELGLDFDHIGAVGGQPDHLTPWYEFEHPREDWRVFFGHWAWLEGRINHNGAVSTDGGYVWGGKLIARRVEDDQLFSIDAPDHPS